METLPNIPSIQSSVEDQTLAQQDVPQGRTPLIPYFSKYNSEEIQEFSNHEYFLYKTGAVNVAKFGLGSIFIRDALTETRRVLGQRLVASDATFANIALNRDNNVLAYAGIHNKKYLFNAEPFLEAEPLNVTSPEWDKWNDKKEAYEKYLFEKSQLVLGQIAKGRGSGYNDIYVAYSEATEYERMDSNIEGEPNYRFNFLKGEVFEKTKTGFRQLGDAFVFSLMDRDLETNEPITDQLAGQVLFANEKVSKSNDFVDININEEYSQEMREVRNIDDLMPDGRLIVPDINNSTTNTNNKYYEVKVETDDTVITKPLVIKPIPTEKMPSIAPRIGYAKNMYPYIDKNRKEITAIITNSSSFDFAHSDNTVNYTDNTNGLNIKTSVSLIIIDIGNQPHLIVKLNNPLSEDLDVPLLIKGTDSYNSNISSAEAPFGPDILTIPAGATEAKINLVDKYGGTPISFEATIITPELVATGVTPLDTYDVDTAPKTTVSNLVIDIREESDDNGTIRNRDYAKLGVIDPLKSKVYLTMSDTTVKSDANHKMVHNVILEDVSAVDVSLSIEYTVTIGSMSETVQLDLILDCEANPTKKEWSFDFYELVKDYSIALYLYKDLFVEAGQLKLDHVEMLTPNAVPESFYVDGEDGFYKLTFNALASKTNDLDEFLLQSYEFLRYNIYSKLVGNVIALYHGSDGEYLYNSKGELNCSGPSDIGKENAKECIIKALDNKELKNVLYPKFSFDYLPTWCEDIDVINKGIDLCDATEMSYGIHSIPTSYDVNFTTEGQELDDINIRKNELYKSTQNNELTTSQRNKTHKDIFNGSEYYMPASYYALMNHLKIDREISITEPVANIEKGQIRNGSINLQYAPDAYEIEKLRNNQINSIIIENDGTYFIDQLTMLKKRSKLNNANTVKTIQQLRKNLPKKLKPFLQKKAIGDIKEGATNAALIEANKFKITNDNPRDGLFEFVEIKPYYNEVTKRLRLSMTVSPVGTIEVIEVPIVVV